MTKEVLYNEFEIITKIEKYTFVNGKVQTGVEESDFGDHNQFTNHASISLVDADFCHQ